MQLIGFVLFAIGCAVAFFARRIVMAKTTLEKEDEEEFNLLASGGILAVKLTGFVVAVIGLIFMMMA